MLYEDYGRVSEVGIEDGCSIMTDVAQDKVEEVKEAGAL